MKIGILGAGNVGSTLGKRWQEAGHDIRFGVHNPQDPKYADRIPVGASLVTVPEVAKGVDVLVLATPWDATEDALRAAGSLSGMTLVDCTNPLLPDLSGLTHGQHDSGGEQVARWAEGAWVVKAFNTIGANIMADPSLDGRKAVHYLCGDHDEAKARVRELSEALGFETVDAGPLASARMLEPFALLWISSAYRCGLGREFAYSLIRRK